MDKKRNGEPLHPVEREYQYAHIFRWDSAGSHQGLNLMYYDTSISSTLWWLVEVFGQSLLSDSFRSMNVSREYSRNPIWEFPAGWQKLTNRP